MISFGMPMSEYSSAIRASPLAIASLQVTHFDRPVVAGSIRLPTAGL